MKNKPRLDQLQLLYRDVPSKQLPINSYACLIVLIVCVDMRFIVLPNVGEQHFDDDAIEAAQFRHTELPFFKTPHDFSVRANARAVAV